MLRGKVVSDPTFALVLTLPFTVPLREATPFDRSIDVQVSRLRHLLHDSGREPRIIKTVRNGGYVLAAAVERLEE